MHLERSKPDEGRARQASRTIREYLQEHLGLEVPARLSLHRYIKQHQEDNPDQWRNVSPEHVTELVGILNSFDEFRERIRAGYRPREGGGRDDRCDASYDFVVQAVRHIPSLVLECLEKMPALEVPKEESAPNLKDGSLGPVNKSRKKIPHRKDEKSDDELIADMLDEEREPGPEEDKQDGESAEEEKEERYDNPYNDLSREEVERVKAFFEKFSLPSGEKAKTNAAVYGSGVKEEQEKIPIGRYRADDDAIRWKFEESLATLLPSIVLEEGRNQDWISYIKENLTDYRPVASHFRVQVPPRLEGELADNEIECEHRVHGHSGVAMIPLSHKFQVSSAICVMQDGTTQEVPELLSCRLGGLLIEVPPGVERLIIRHTPQDQNLGYGDLRALNELIPASMQLFEGDAGVANLLGMIDQQFVPKMVRDYLIEEQLRYTLGPEIHGILSSAGPNWHHFVMGFKAAGKCGQLSSLAAAGMNNLGIPSLMIGGVKPKEGELDLTNGHAQALCVVETKERFGYSTKRIPLAVEATKGVKFARISTEGADMDLVGKLLKEIPGSEPARAREIGAELHEHLVEQSPLNDLQLPLELLEELKKARGNQGECGNPLPEEEGLTIQFILKVASSLKTFNKTLEEAKQNPSVAAIQAGQDKCDQVPLESGKPEIQRIGRELSRVLALNTAIDVLKDESSNPLQRKTFFDTFLGLLEGYTTQVKTWTASGKLGSEHYSKASSKELLECLTDEEIEQFEDWVIQLAHPPGNSIDFRCDNSCFSINNELYRLGRSVLDEKLRRNQEPSDELMTSLILLNRLSNSFTSSRDSDSYARSIFYTDLPELEDKFIPALARVIFHGNGADIAAMLASRNGDKTYPTSELAKKIMDYLILHGPEFVEESLRQHDRYLEGDEKKRNSGYAHRLKYWSDLIVQINTWNGKPIVFPCPSEPLAERIAALFYKSAEDLECGDLNPPTENYPLSRYLQRAGPAVQISNAADLFAMTGLTRPIDEYMEIPTSEISLAARLAEQLEDRGTGLVFWGHSDSIAYSWGLPLSLEAMKDELPELTQLTRFLNVEGTEDRLLHEFQRQAPVAFETLVKSSQKAIDGGRNWIPSMCKLALKKLEDIDGAEAALLWVKAVQLRDPEVVNEAAKRLAELPDGLESNNQALSTALGSPLNTVRSYYRGVLGPLDLRSIACGVLLLQTITSESMAKPSERYGEPGPPEFEKITRNLSIFRQREKRFAEMLKLQRNGSTGDTLLAGIRFVTECDKPHVREDKYDHIADKETALQCIEEATAVAFKKANAQRLTQQGKGWVFYEHTLKRPGVKRFTRISSGEVTDIRPYQAGDNLSRINWQVYARTDKFYINDSIPKTHEPCLTIVVPASNLGSDDLQRNVDELMSHVVQASMNGVKQVNIVISAGVGISRFDNVNAKVSRGANRFATPEFKEALAKAISGAARLSSYTPGFVKEASLLAFSRIRPTSKKENFLVIGARGQESRAFDEDIHRITRAGASVYAIDRSQLYSREKKLHPEKVRERERPFRGMMDWGFDERSVLAEEPYEMEEVQKLVAGSSEEEKKE